MGKNETGFTLIELVIAMFISFVVIGAIYLTYSTSLKTSSLNESIVIMQQNIRSGMSFILEDLKMAGYDPDPSNSAGTGFKAGTDSDTIVIDMVTPSDPPPNPITRNEYTYMVEDTDGDGTTELTMEETVGVGSPAPTVVKYTIAEHIEDISFVYILDDGTRVPNPSPSELNRIRSVETTLLARTERRVNDYTNSHNYDLPVDSEESSWGPFNDSFRRMIMTRTVFCRNLN